MGVSAERIHFERFGIAAAGDTGEWDIALGDQKRLRFAGHRTLLDALESGGAQIDADCRTGSCGRCAITVKAGELHQLIEPEFKTDASQVLACCCVPKSNIELEMV